MKQLASSCLIIVVACTVLSSDAQVSLDTLDTLHNSFICGDKQVLICTIEAYTSMTWTKDTFPDPLATCSFPLCNVNPSMTANYNFTFDTDNGIFEMSIPKVTVADNGTTYFCSDGFVVANILTIVKVEDDCSIVKDYKTLNSDTTEVSVNTGCIKDSAAHDVKFDWWFKEVNNTNSEKIKIVSATVTNYDSSVCIADPDCGVSGYSYIKNSVNISNEESGKTYSIGVDVTCGDGLITSVSFDLIFILNFPVSETPTCNNDCYKEIAFMFIFISIIIIQMCFFEVYQYYVYLKQMYVRFCSEKQREAKSNELRLKDKRLRLEKKLAVDLKKLTLEGNRFRLEMQRKVDLNELRFKDKRFSFEKKLEADLNELSLKEERLRSQMKDAAVSNELQLKDERLRTEMKDAAVSNELQLKDKRLSLEKKLEADLNELQLEDERLRTEMKDAAVSNELQLKDKRLRLEKKLEAGLNKLTLEDKRLRLQMQHTSDLNELQSKDKRLRLEKKLEADLNKLTLEDNRYRSKMQRELALEKPPVKTIFGITLLCSVPFISLMVKGLLVFNRRKSVHRRCLLVTIVVGCVAFSLFCEIYMILLCVVSWYCQLSALHLINPDLMCRWILCIIIAVLYHGDKDKPASFTRGIALSCMPIVGLIYNLLRHIRNKLAKNSSVSPEPDVDHRTGETYQDANSTPGAMQTPRP